MLTATFLLTILVHGFCLDNGGQLYFFENACTDTEAICLLQSSLKVKRAQTPKSGPVTGIGVQQLSDMGSSPLERFSLLATAPDVRISGVDEKTQVVLGLLLVLVVGALSTVVCMLFKRKDDYEEEEEEYLIHLDSKKQVPTRHLTESLDSQPILNSPIEGKVQLSQQFQLPSLSASFVVPPHSEVLYYLPVISQRRKSANALVPTLLLRKPVEAFQITDVAGRPVMGVLVKDSDGDPGILIHKLTASPGEAGMPIAFIETHPDARRRGKMRIAIPSSKHQWGSMFGMLEKVGESYTVVRDGQGVLWIENQSITGNRPIFRLTAGVNGGGKEFGTSSRRGDQIEAHFQENTDGALAIICLLAIQRMQ